MMNFDFKRPSRKCSVEDRALAPGEQFYSALIELADGQVERVDMCEAVWNGPPENCIGWWVSTVPELTKGRVYWAPNSVLLAYFEHLYENRLIDEITYLTGLVLVQKKILRLVETLEDADPPVMVLKHGKTNKVFELPVADIPPNRILELQTELSERLFTDRAPNEDEEQANDD